MDKLSYHNGPVIQKAQIVPIFWGSAWSTPTMTSAASEVVAEIRQLISGPYMRALAQYSSVAPASIAQPTFDAKSEPPAKLSIDALDGYLQVLIPTSVIPDYRSNDQILYLVFTDGVNWETANVGGFHAAGAIDDASFHWAWSSSASTYIASHVHRRPF